MKRSLSSSTRVSWDRTGRVQGDVREEVTVQQHLDDLGQDGAGRAGPGDVREEVAVQQHPSQLGQDGVGRAGPEGRT